MPTTFTDATDVNYISDYKRKYWILYRQTQYYSQLPTDVFEKTLLIDMQPLLWEEKYNEELLNKHGRISGIVGNPAYISVMLLNWKEIKGE
jgi:hypothetical protein